MTRSRAAFIFIFITVLLDMVSFGVIIPVFPQLILRLQGGDMAGAAAIFGILGTAFAIMQVIFAPVQGALSDRYGRRPVILLSNLGLGVDYVVMAVAPTIPILFIGRLISGATSASFSISGAYVADVTPPEKRAARFGMLGVAFGIGFIVGPAIGGLLGAIDLRAPFWFSAVLSFANFLYGLLILPESLPPERRGPFRLRAANPIGAMRFLGLRPVLFTLGAVAFFGNLGHDALPNTFVLYATQRFNFDERAIGLSLAIVGVSSLIVQGFVVGRAVAALGEYRALLAGLGLGIAAELLLGLAPTSALFLIGLPIFSFFGLTGASLQSLATREVAANEQGQLQGALSSLRSICTIITPGLYTGTFALFVGPLAGLGVPGAPFLLAAILLASAFAVLARSARALRSPAVARPS
ncbi:MAG: TCR/Tet family MFS transporter [Chloroflexi bacterium]|nr:MAG: TCR/Tet family MFS transporter [Chloroflexota bacterium]TMB91302.1 MAG: TCR/Tet family MFS transporter [Chloroflexota bacterium]